MKKLTFPISKDKFISVPYNDLSEEQRNQFIQPASFDGAFIGSLVVSNFANFIDIPANINSFEELFVAFSGALNKMGFNSSSLKEILNFISYHIYQMEQEKFSPSTILAAYYMLLSPTFLLAHSDTEDFHQNVVKTSIWFSRAISFPSFSQMDLKKHFHSMIKAIDPDLYSLPIRDYSAAIENFLIDPPYELRHTASPMFDNSILSEYKKQIRTVIADYKKYIALPDNLTDVFFGSNSTNPLLHDYYEAALTALFGICDGGIREWISKNNKISHHEWCVALDLFLRCGMFNSVPYEERIRSMAEVETGSTLFADYLDFILSHRNSIALAQYDIKNTYTSFLLDSFPATFSMAILIHALHTIPRETSVQVIAADKISDKEKNTEEKLNNAQKEINRLMEDNRKLRTSLKSIRETQSAAEKKRYADMTLLEHKCNSNLKEKDREIEILKESILKLNKKISEQEHQLMVAQEFSEPEKPWLNIALPDTNVLFLGGHENMVNKLREIYPKWTFISSFNSSTSLPTTVKVIFIWAAHLSHLVWYRVDRFYPDRSLMRYVQATNISKLVEEMQYEYYKLCAENKNMSNQITD